MIQDLYVPVLTPFTAAGPIDHEALAAHCAWTVANGANGVMLFGTTGEGPSVGVDEKIEAARRLIEQLPGISVIGSVTENAITDTLRCVRAYNELDLAATLVLPPSYFREESTDGLHLFYERVVATAEHPVLAYHIPSMAPFVPLSVCADLPVWGAKDSSGDLAYTQAVIATGKSAMVGAESLVITAMRGGASGTIAGMGNLAPRDLASLCDATRAGRVDEAQRHLDAVLALHAAVLRAAPEREWVAAFKQVAGYRTGVALGVARLPLISRRDYLTPEVRDALSRSAVAASA